MKAVAQVAADFDEIAKALAAGSAHEELTPAERALLAHTPAHARRAIDVGCGDGVITRALARRGLDIIGIDVSPGMVDLARTRTDPALGVTYRLADVMTGELPDGAFDLVVSISMAHHLALERVVPRLARLLVPGGTLLLQDVMNRRGLSQLPANAIAVLANRVRRLVQPSRVTSRVAAAYHAHGANEDYLDVSVVRPTYASLLPGARVLLHLEWRYSVVWHSSALPT